MNTVAVCFTNFGPYHLARLRALARALERSGRRLIAYETAGTETLYPWITSREREPFEWITLFPDRTLESLPRPLCARAMRKALDRDQPDALGIVGYVRPESLAMLNWGAAKGLPTVLMSESQAIDHPRVWWKEAVKRRRVTRFSSALVGGPSHADYLASLGMPESRIALGYNAVDGANLAERAAAFRREPSGRDGLPTAPFFLAVSRFAREKNLVALVNAYARYRDERPSEEAWDLVLCGGGPGGAEVDAAVRASDWSASIHRPGFLQAGELARWYAFASAFVHPSLMEPWGLVVNEAAACGLPLLVSERAGVRQMFVPEDGTSTGALIDGRDLEGMAAALGWMANLNEARRQAMGTKAAEIAAQWGPSRFASGAMEAFQMAVMTETLRTGGRRAWSSAG